MKRVAVLLFFVLVLAVSSFASEVISKEAVNYYNQGVELQKASNFQAAEAMYQKTLLIDPYDVKWQVYILNNRGVALASLGRVDEAEVLFNEALKLDGNYLPAKLNLGFIYEQRRSELESIKYWLRVLKIDLDSVKPKGYVIEDNQ
jgi:tetratricopeptide (TPR) repeat protein